MIITRAVPANIPWIEAALGRTTSRVVRRGRPSWPSQFTYDRLLQVVAAGDFYLVWDGGPPLAMLAVSAAGEPAFWSPRELAEPASYVSTMARAGGPAGVGAMMLDWVVNAAHERGDRWVRLDAGRGNEQLQQYYRDRGFSLVRTETVPGRNSGALFQRLALPTAHPFTAAPALPGRGPTSRPPGRVLAIGDEVVTADWQEGHVVDVLDPGAGAGVVPQPGEYGTDSRPAVHYRVKFDDGGERVLFEGDVTTVADIAAAAAWPLLGRLPA